MTARPSTIDPQRYLSIPYKWYGRGFDGCDCWGLAWLIHHHELGQEIPRNSPPAFVAVNNPTWATILRANGLAGNGLEGDGYAWREVRLCEVRPGDILLAPPLHVLVWLGEGRAIHQVNAEHQVVVEEWARSEFANQVVAIYRFVPRPPAPSKLLKSTPTAVSRFCAALGIPMRPCDTPSGRGADPDALHQVLALHEARDEWVTSLLSSGTEGVDFAFDNMGRPHLAEALVCRIVLERGSVRCQVLAQFLSQCEQVHQVLSAG